MLTTVFCVFILRTMRASTWLKVISIAAVSRACGCLQRSIQDGLSQAMSLSNDAFTHFPLLTRMCLPLTATFRDMLYYAEDSITCLWRLLQWIKKDSVEWSPQRYRRSLKKKKETGMSMQASKSGFVWYGFGNVLVYRCYEHSSRKGHHNRHHCD